MQIRISLSKRFLMVAGTVLLLGSGSAFLYLKLGHANPLPANIKPKVSYKVVFPADTSQIDASTYNYQEDKQILSFAVHTGQNSVIFTEQPAPQNLGSDTQAYYPALGVHPYAQFKTGLGQVALAKFWQSGNLKPAGQSAIMAARGTLLIAHADNELTNQQWKNLFDSMKISP